MIIRGLSQEQIARGVEGASKAFYTENRDFDEKRISIDRSYWNEVTIESLELIGGQTERLTRTLFERGLTGELSPHAPEFALAINVNYKGYTRVKARVFNMNFLRFLLHGTEIPRPAEYEILFSRFSAWKNEYLDWKNLVKTRLKSHTPYLGINF
jgi:hypothetical protein